MFGFKSRNMRFLFICCAFIISASAKVAEYGQINFFDFYHFYYFSRDLIPISLQLENAFKSGVVQKNEETVPEPPEAKRAIAICKRLATDANAYFHLFRPKPNYKSNPSVDVSTISVVYTSTSNYDYKHPKKEREAHVPFTIQTQKCTLQIYDQHYDLYVAAGPNEGNEEKYFLISNLKIDLQIMADFDEDIRTKPQLTYDGYFLMGLVTIKDGEWEWRS